ncbi:MAG: hypothetical protein Q9169_008345 [Polycauliona sp. 2 TL-2023]
MRLLHTERLEFQEFFDSQIPKYAILSHRWTSDEVSFQDFELCKEQRRPSFDKIKNFCSLANKDGHEWGWIDTCCIDKRSSAELSEAINSMYSWYKQAEVCYAYLMDVLKIEHENGKWRGSRAQYETYAQVRHSVWFTRGWTLQELLAPHQVDFYDVNWDYIGTKGGFSRGLLIPMDIVICDITGIASNDLNWIESQCIAKKLSWVSRRETTRIEDMAYCMLGLCDVNMPLLYGEGHKAFRRLQLEIIRNTDDESIYAWFCNSLGSPESFESGMIAPAPQCFANSGHIAKAEHEFGSLALKSKSPYSMTNKGLAYPIYRAKIWKHQQFLNSVPSSSSNCVSYSIPLNCFAMSSTSAEAPEAYPLGTPRGKKREENRHFLTGKIVIIQLFRSGGVWKRIQLREQHIRIFPQALTDIVKEEAAIETIYIRESGIKPTTDSDDKWLADHRPPQGW